MGYNKEYLENFSAGDYVEIKDSTGIISNGVIYPCTVCDSCGTFVFGTNSKLVQNDYNRSSNYMQVPVHTYLYEYELIINYMKDIKLIS